MLNPIPEIGPVERSWEHGVLYLVAARCARWEVEPDSTSTVVLRELHRRYVQRQLEAGAVYLSLLQFTGTIRAAGWRFYSGPQRRTELRGVRLRPWEDGPGAFPSVPIVPAAMEIFEEASSSE